MEELGMAPENLQPTPNRLVQFVHRVGETLGMRPDWYDQEAWEAHEPGQRRMIRMFHDSGTKHFRVLRSAETSMKTYVRREPGE